MQAPSEALLCLLLRMLLLEQNTTNTHERKVSQQKIPTTFALALTHIRAHLLTGCVCLCCAHARRLSGGTTSPLRSDGGRRTLMAHVRRMRDFGSAHTRTHTHASTRTRARDTTRVARHTSTHTQIRPDNTVFAFCYLGRHVSTARKQINTGVVCVCSLV